MPPTNATSLSQIDEDAEEADAAGSGVGAEGAGAGATGKGAGAGAAAALEEARCKDDALVALRGRRRKRGARVSTRCILATAGNAGERDSTAAAAMPV